MNSDSMKINPSGVEINASDVEKSQGDIGTYLSPTSVGITVEPLRTVLMSMCRQAWVDPNLV